MVRNTRRDKSKSAPGRTHYNSYKLVQSMSNGSLSGSAGTGAKHFDQPPPPSPRAPVATVLTRSGKDGPTWGVVVSPRRAFQLWEEGGPSHKRGGGKQISYCGKRASV